MAVNYRHPSYDANSERWSRARMCVEGSDAVKAQGVKFLPKLDFHIKHPLKYKDYLQRAVFYNMTGRTVEGLTGAICQKTPTFKTIDEKDLKDITASGVSAEMFALRTVQEVLIGRFGVLLEVSKTGGPDKHPYWCGYAAEDIVNWRTSTEDGEEILTMVVLRQMKLEPDPKDPDGFAMTVVEHYLVCELINKTYTQTLWRKDEKSGKFVKMETVTPLRREQPLDFIPFVFINPTSTTADVQKPPLDDLVVMNLAHYQNSADFEHGLHFTGVPIPWVAGATSKTGQTMSGPETLLQLEKGGTFNITQADGEVLGALRDALKAKEERCAVLGARLLEFQSMGDETATAAVMRHSGEHATLRTIAQSAEQGLTKVAKWHVWWSSTGEGKPLENDAEVGLNKDFFSARMTAQDLTAIVAAWQSEAMDFETMYWNLERGEMTRPGVTAKQVQKLIKSEAPEPALPPGMMAHPTTGLPVPNPAFAFDPKKDPTKPAPGANLPALPGRK